MCDASEDIRHIVITLQTNPSCNWIQLRSTSAKVITRRYRLSLPNRGRQISAGDTIRTPPHQQNPEHMAEKANTLTFYTRREYSHWDRHQPGHRHHHHQ